MVNTFTITQEPSASDFFIYPNADVAGCTEHTPYGDTTNNYPNIDELKDAPNDDTDYNYNDTANLYVDLFDLPNAIKTGVINYIQVFARAKSHEFPQAPAGIYKIAISPSSTCTDYYLSQDFDLLTSYTLYSNVWTTNPLTSATWLWSIFATDMAIGYQSSSPQITFDKNTLFRPSAAGDETNLNFSGGASSNWDANIDCNSEYVYTFIPDAGWIRDLYNIPDHTTETGTISKVVVYAVAQPYGYQSGEEGIMKIAIKTGGTVFESDEHVMTFAMSGKNLFSETWLINPDTSATWTWANIDGLQIGISLNRDTADGCRNWCVYAIVYYTEPDNPEIRTTQCYMKVNYAPPTDTCYLNKPNKISTNHSRNIKMINFWSGNREVYDLNRSGKSMLLTGTEFYHPDCTDLCARIDYIRKMGLADVEISITDLGSDLWNGTYFIRSFGWKHMLGCPDWYEWALDLEDTRHAEVGDGYD